MCGFVVWAGPAGSVDERALHAGLDAIAHRGPDGRGVYVSPDRSIALGHVRLALVGGASGAQPIATGDAALHAVVNGEIYEDAAWRAALTARGHVFRTDSDSEVLLHLLREQGPAAFAGIRGELAAVIYDAARRELIFGRDRFGIKPLVFAADRGGVWLASEAKALFACGVLARWDARSLAHVCTHQYLPPTRTLFAGVHSVPPGACGTLKVGATEPSIRRYWRLGASASGSAHVREDEPLLHAIRQAVTLRMRGDAVPALHLSGGVDSTALLALARAQSTAPLSAFSVQFSSEAYAEGHLAERSAAELGVALHLVDASQEALLAALPDAVYAGETLGINGQLPAKLLLSRAIGRAGFRSVLSGEGADEAFLGYAHLAVDAAAPGARVGGVQGGVMLADEAAPQRHEEIEAAFGFVPHFLRAKYAIGQRFAACWRSDALPPHVPFAELATELAEGVEASVKLRSHARQSSCHWVQLALSGYILRALGDGVEMAASIEGRPPFLDHVLFERAFALDDAQLFSSGLTKVAMREALVGIVPEDVRLRPKHPFLAPPLLAQSPRSNAGLRALRTLLDPERVKRVPFLDSAKVQAFLARAERLHAEGADALPLLQREEPTLHLLLATVVLQERMNLGDPR